MATFPADFKLPGSITNIGEYAFSGAHFPANFTVPHTASSIEDSAFIGATIMKSGVYVPFILVDHRS